VLVHPIPRSKRVRSEYNFFADFFTLIASVCTDTKFWVYTIQPLSFRILQLSALTLHPLWGCTAQSSGGKLGSLFIKVLNFNAFP
jgi:hypothetical protein